MTGKAELRRWRLSTYQIIYLDSEFIVNNKEVKESTVLRIIVSTVILFLSQALTQAAIANSDSNVNSAASKVTVEASSLPNIVEIAEPTTIFLTLTGLVAIYFVRRAKA